MNLSSSAKRSVSVPRAGSTPSPAPGALGSDRWPLLPAPPLPFAAGLSTIRRCLSTIRRCLSSVVVGWEQLPPHVELERHLHLLVEHGDSNLTVGVERAANHRSELRAPGLQHVAAEFEGLELVVEAVDTEAHDPKPDARLARRVEGEAVVEAARHRVAGFLEAPRLVLLPGQTHLPGVAPEAVCAGRGCWLQRARTGPWFRLDFGTVL